MPKLRSLAPIATIAAVLAFALAACSSGSHAAAAALASPAPSARLVISAEPSASVPPLASPTASPTPHDPQTYDGARAAAKHMDAAWARHDFGAFWDLMTDTGKALISRTDYIYVVKHCPGLGKQRDAIISISLNDSKTVATVTASEGDDPTPFQWQMLYVHGQWLHQPSDSASVWMGKSRSAALADLRSTFTC